MNDSLRRLLRFCVGAFCILLTAAIALPIYNSFRGSEIYNRATHVAPEQLQYFGFDLLNDGRLALAVEVEGQGAVDIRIARRTASSMESDERIMELKGQAIHSWDAVRGFDESIKLRRGQWIVMISPSETASAGPGVDVKVVASLNR